MATGRRLIGELRDPFRLEAIDCPVLLVWGRQDVMVFQTGADRVLDAVEHSQLVTIEDCGHCPQLENPDRLMQLLLDFPAARPCGLPMRLPDPERIIDSAVTGWDLLVGPRRRRSDAARRRRSSTRAPQCTVHRYRSRRARPRRPHAGAARAAAGGARHLLRPPPGLHLAEHLTALGYPTYLVDYGAISFSDRALGLEHWVEDVIPDGGPGGLRGRRRRARAAARLVPGRHPHPALGGGRPRSADRVDRAGGQPVRLREGAR